VSAIDEKRKFVRHNMALMLATFESELGREFGANHGYKYIFSVLSPSGEEIHETNVTATIAERTRAATDLLAAAGVAPPIFAEMPSPEEWVDIVEAMARARGLMPGVQ
jgi:hypothetical protein